jgi:hypothetical protein
MAMRNRDNPNRVAAYCVSHVVRKRAQVHSTITSRPKSRRFRMSDDRVYSGHHLIAEPGTQPRLPGFIVSHRHNEVRLASSSVMSSSPEVAVDVLEHFGKRASLRQSGINPLNPALDFFLPRRLGPNVSKSLGTLQKCARQSQLFVLCQTQRLLSNFRNAAIHGVKSINDRNVVELMGIHSFTVATPLGLWRSLSIYPGYLVPRNRWALGRNPVGILGRMHADIDRTERT